EEEGDDEELCFICTEPVVTYAVGPCDHRTCHKCTLRLRALYKTRNCAYCKIEQKSVIFTSDAEKPFASFLPDDTPFTDKRLAIRFESQAIYKEAMHMLQYNCPQCGESSDDWFQLKLHVRKTHNLNICDLCSRHKKVFPFEHVLYTASNLAIHSHEGDKSFRDDDDTGFAGHPECAFCCIRFYDDDALFVHCRDQHEQCFLCVRSGRRHEYYANYDSLEQHFEKDHYVCRQPRCVEKKFVVFESDIDLRAHEVQEHPELGNKLLELSFKYESSRDQKKKKNSNREGTSSRRGGTSSSSSNVREENNVVSNSSNDEEEFPSMESVRSSLPRTTVPGAPTRKKKGKEKAATIQKPAGFGALSGNNNNSSSSSSGSGSSGLGPPLTTANDPTLTRHATFLSNLKPIMDDRKIDEFRKLTSQYRNNTITGDDYRLRISNLVTGDVQKTIQILKGVEKLIDNEQKKSELARMWRDQQLTYEMFPEPVRRPAPTSRVLVIKKPTKRQEGNVWDKAAATASSSTAVRQVTSNSSSSSNSSSRISSVRSSPQSSRPSSPILSKTPWSQSQGRTAKSSTTGPSRPVVANQDLFPALPTATPKHQLVLNVRKAKQGGTMSAWNSSGNTTPTGGSDLEEYPLNNSSKKKKKGRQANVLFKVGL
ncbi:MAG: hypothetical protein EXX96DRAFT_636421, partial [Benjaminiella poitrasii]